MYLVTFFLEKGADINHGNANGWTPLMLAIEGRKLENVKLLLDCGAEVEKTNKRGNKFRVLSGKYDFEKGRKKFRDFAFLSLLPSSIVR